MNANWNRLAALTLVGAVALGAAATARADDNHWRGYGYYPYYSYYAPPPVIMAPPPVVVAPPPVVVAPAPMLALPSLNFIFPFRFR